MMSRTLAVLALAGAAACAGRAKPTPEALAGLVGDKDYPVEAWLSHSRISDLAFSVNQPSYVAIFYIAPGRGVSMLYPTYRDELNATDAGYNVPGYRYDSGQWYFLNTAFSPIATSPSYLLLIASREPLRVAEYERYPGLLRRALGFNTFASYDSWDVIDELTRLVVPPQPDDAWSTDLVVLWPGMRANTRYASADYYGSRLFVRCDNGRVLMVPWDYPYGGCPFFSTHQPRPTPPLAQPETPGDSTDAEPAPEKPGEEPSSPRPGEPDPESEHPKRELPRRVRDRPEAADRSERLARETPVVAGRRTREAYTASDARRAPRAWDRSALSHSDPQMGSAATRADRASRGGRASSEPVHTQPPRATRSSRPASQVDRSSPGAAQPPSTSRPSSPERPASSGASAPDRPAPSERSSGERPSVKP